MFSDGFPDQFGGPKDKKFMNKKFKALLQEIQTLSPNEQLSRLDSALENWRGDTEQVDDVLVIGFVFKILIMSIQNLFQKIISMSKILSLLFLTLSFSAFAGEPLFLNEKTQSIKLEKEVFITPVDGDEDFSEIEYQLINEQNSGIKFFLDQTPHIYIDAHSIYVKPNTVDSTFIKY